VGRLFYAQIFGSAGGFAEKDRGLLNDQLFANTFGLEDVITWACIDLKTGVQSQGALLDLTAVDAKDAVRRAYRQTFYLEKAIAWIWEDVDAVSVQLFLI
jgi:hypothetical protein